MFAEIVNHTMKKLKLFLNVRQEQVTEKQNSPWQAMHPAETV